jgi:hypothetical protein
MTNIGNARAVATFSVYSTLALSLALNVYFGLNAISAGSRRSTTAKHDGPPLGALLPALAGTTLDGRKVTLTYGENPNGTIVYVFSPGCSWCDRNADAFGALAIQIGSKYQVVALALDTRGLTQFLARHALPRPVWLPAPETRLALALGATPTTFLVAPDGRLKRWWRGAFSNAVTDELEHLFNVRLNRGDSQP